jgi:hypothetical protein
MARSVQSLWHGLVFKRLFVGKQFESCFSKKENTHPSNKTFTSRSCDSICLVSDRLLSVVSTFHTSTGVQQHHDDRLQQQTAWVPTQNPPRQATPVQAETRQQDDYAIRPLRHTCSRTHYADRFAYKSDRVKMRTCLVRHAVVAGRGAVPVEACTAHAPDEQPQCEPLRRVQLD